MAEYPWPPLASAPPVLATLDDVTPFTSPDVPELRDPTSGRISESAAALRIEAAASGGAADALPGMLPFQLPSRPTGSFFGGLFGSHFIPHGAHSSGLCCSSVEHYRYLLLGLQITDRYNAVCAAPGRRGSDVELGRDLLWLLWAAEGLVWAGPAFADYLCALWDDYFADLHIHGTPFGELCTGERLQLAATSVVSYRAVSAGLASGSPFAAGLVEHSAPRFAAVLLSALRASNPGAGAAVPLVPPPGSSGTHGRLVRLAAELAGLCVVIVGRGSRRNAGGRYPELAGVPGLEDALRWASTRVGAIRGAGGGDSGGGDADLLDELLRLPGMTGAPWCGRNLLEPSTEWPAWMLRRAGVPPSL